jgi:hypothetical protein
LFLRTYLENTHHKIKGLVEWLKVKALNSSLSEEEDSLETVL